MRILVGHNWDDDFLDQSLLGNSVRIRPHIWWSLAKIDDLYFIPEKSGRLILNYIKEIGIRAVVRKIISRLNESTRNEKYLSVGIGIVLDSQSSQFFKNDPVIFTALCHPRCMERIVLPEDLIKHCDDREVIQNLHSNRIIYLENQTKIPQDLYLYRGWSEYSGIKLPDTIKKELSDFIPIIKQEMSKSNQVLTLTPSDNNHEIKSSVVIKKERLRAGIFGYGQYAKTIILPSISQLVDVVKVHEIDPAQIPRKRNKYINYDTSPVLNEDDHFDICFIASYHHTHAPLAVQALKSGKAVVVEKPIVTHWQDLKKVLAAMKTSQSPLFSCFQKRYLSFNRYIHHDLGIQRTDPLSFHCIVFEVPLPTFHWYAWPHSGSRLLSNGCHWIDYFLYLNAFSKVTDYSLKRAKNNDLQVLIELENQALFTMILTEIGSNRLGLREHIELRAGKQTVTITDGRQYRAENKCKIIRKIQMKRLLVYQNMYQSIVQCILQNKPGDSVESVERSASIILSLEDLYQKKASASTKTTTCMNLV